MAAIVLKKPHPEGHIGTLLAGQSFWLSLNVPQRNRFKELIQINGGTVVLQEKDADIKLVDHARRDIPLNSYSYRFIEKSVASGRLEDLEDHRAGQSTRPVGAVGIPARSSRIPFTLQDDQILWDWMQPFEKRRDQVSGNIVYQQLASQYPRHTFQSWRDRYLKKLRGRPRPGGPAEVTEERSPEQPISSQRDASRENSLSRSTRVETLNRQNTSTARITKSDIQRTPNLSEQGTASAHVSRPEPRAGNPGKERSTTAAKRKRLSHEGTSTVSNLEVDDAARKRRRATDFVPQNDPFVTPVQSQAVPINRHKSNSQNAKTTTTTTTTTSDESQSTQFETAPQYPPSAPETQTQPPSSLTPSQLEEEANFKALMELPYPAAAPASPAPGSNNVQTASESEGVEEWVQKRIVEGQSVDHVLLALSCTSMDAELADQVLVLLSSGQGIPNDRPGVWTEQDDEVLMGTEGRAIELLNKKHGKEYFNRRYKYLEDRAEALQLVAKEGP